MVLINCDKRVHVYDFKEASEKIRNTIERENMGSEKWYSFKNNGTVLLFKKPVAKISYNGRIQEGGTT